MAAPGLGVGDIVNACNYIYTKCMQYKDGVKEFEEIASKAKSTNVVIQRLEDEAKNRGSLVERAGSQAYEQLENNLKLLREDAKKLRELIVKYATIQDIRGRRLLFVFRESDNLTDLRRRIGLHERALELWYSTLVYESLRRLENGQADIFAGQEDIFAAIKAMDIPTIEAIKAELRRGKEGLLTNELRRRTPSRPVTEQDIDVAKTYVTASQLERTNIEDRSRMYSSTSHRRTGRENSQSHNVTGDYTFDPYASNGDHHDTRYHKQPPHSGPARPTYMKVRRKYLDPRTLDAFSLPWEWDHTNPDYLLIKIWVSEPMQDELFAHTEKLRESDKLIDRVNRYNEEEERGRQVALRHLENLDVYRSHYGAPPSPSPSPSAHKHPNIVLTHAHRPPQRRSSDASARPGLKPFLDIPLPDRKGRNRPSSYHEPRGSPRRSSEVEREEVEVLIVEQGRRRREGESQRHREGGGEGGGESHGGKGASRSRSRHGSTHSYHRRRAGSDGGVEGAKIRMVDRMDRIDSLDTQDGWGVRL